MADENKAKVKESSSKKTSKKKDEEEDSALEVLEDADDLIKEGVKVRAAEWLISSAF